MLKIFSFIQKYLFWLILSSIISGLILVKLTGGYAFTPIFCVLAAFLMIYPSLIPLEFGKIKEIGKHQKLITISIAINFIVSPLVALVLGRIFLSTQPALWLGLILLSILPGGGMVTTWAYRSKADMPLTIGIVFANLLVAVILSPLYLSAFLNNLPAIATKSAEAQSCVIESVTSGKVNCLFGGSGSISPGKIALPIVIIILIPLVLAYFTQKSLKKKYTEEKFQDLKKNFAAFSNLGLLVVLFLLMGISQNKIIFEDPALLVTAAPPLAIFYLINLSLAWWLYKSKPGAEGKAMAWGTYLRYITLALGLAISLVYQNPEYSLSVIVVVLAYLIQIPSSFWLANKFNN